MSLDKEFNNLLKSYTRTQMFEKKEILNIMNFQQNFIKYLNSKCNTKDVL